MRSPLPRLSRRRLLQAAAGVFVARLARAQGLSSRPIRVILGQTAATTPDLIPRLPPNPLKPRGNHPGTAKTPAAPAGPTAQNPGAKAPAAGPPTTGNATSPQ